MVPNAKISTVKEENDLYKVYVNALAIDGKANEAVVKILAEYFNVKKKDISIVKGIKNPLKIVAINCS